MLVPSYPKMQTWLEEFERLYGVCILNGGCLWALLDLYRRMAFP